AVAATKLMSKVERVILSSRLSARGISVIAMHESPLRHVVGGRCVSRHTLRHFPHHGVFFATKRLSRTDDYYFCGAPAPGGAPRHHERAFSVAWPVLESASEEALQARR